MSTESRLPQKGKWNNLFSTYFNNFSSTSTFQLFKLIKNWGGTGILIEWEDTFPYRGELTDIGSLINGPAYSHEEVVDILNAAKSENLNVIPLIQTFGHLEVSRNTFNPLSLGVIIDFHFSSYWKPKNGVPWEKYRNMPVRFALHIQRRFPW